jgi:hypothetical protein
LYDKAAREVLRLTDAPSAVRAGGKSLRRMNSLDGHAEGYSVEALAGGGCAIRIKHKHSGDIRIQY